MKKILAFLCLLLFFSQDMEAQGKFEREYRIPETEVPEKVVNFVTDSLGLDRVKWYIEESGTGIFGSV